MTSHLKPRRWAAIRSLVAALVVALAASVAPIGVASGAPGDSVLEVVDLRADDRVDPLGIDGDAPQLSWRTESDGRGVVQTAYEVRVASSESALSAADVWSSGRVETAEQLNVRYGGPELESRTRYHWQVRVWDSRGLTSDWSEPAWFETPLLTPSEWQAEWIGGPSDTDRAAGWTDYTVEIDATGTPGRAWGVFLRSSADGSNGYMWQFSDRTPGHPTLRPHIRTNGAWQLGPEVDFTAAGLDADVLARRATFAIAVSGETITTSINGTVVDIRTDASHAQGYVGLRVDAPTTGEIDEEVLVHSMTVTAADGVLWATNFPDGENLLSAGEITDDGLLLNGQHQAIHVPASGFPLLRKDFDSAGEIISARVYASARGNYQLWINGEPVGDQELAPGSTNYDKRIQYQTYDVTDLLTEGRNTIGGALARGWYTGYIAWIGDHWFGDRESLLTQLVIDYADGSTQTVASDGTWTTAPGPFLEADLQMGETYDAREAQEGWNTPGYDDTSWSAVWVDSDGGPDATEKLQIQTDEPVRVTGEQPAVAMTEPTPGVYIYDLGQNLSGVAQVRITGQRGDTVRLRHAEVLDHDGTMYVANLRSARATDHYVFASDGAVTYRPTFTQHGFRYVEITGVDTPPAISDVVGLVFVSDLEMTGSFETSDAMLNQLQSNIVWGQRGNFISVPTDTPARDERLGYLGDLNAFIPTAMFNMESTTFVRKFMRDARDNQLPDGNFPQNAPLPTAACCDPGAAWSDGGVTIPWTVWQTTGDTQVIEEHYEAMEWFFEYLGARFPEHVRVDGPYGDWLHLSDPTPDAVIGTAYYAYVARLMAEMAAAIGEDADAEHYNQLADGVRATFIREFVSDDGAVTGNSQTAYALALSFGLVPEELRDAAGEKLVARVAARDYHLSTGFVGTPWLLHALSATGHEDVAYRLLMNRSMPSWGFQIDRGATTMWEHWDTIDEHGNFANPGMNSFNHYAFGAVGDWMYRNLAGIRPIEPGYRSFEIAPTPGGGVTWATTSFDSRYGRITSDWTIDDEGFRLVVEVPTNTSALVTIPGATAWSVSEGGAPLGSAEGVETVSADRGDVVVRVGSGSYEFRVDPVARQLGELIDAVTALGEDIAGHDELGALLDEMLGGLLSAHETLPEPTAALDHLVDVLDAARRAVALAQDESTAPVVDRVREIEAGISAVAAQLSGVGVVIDLDPAAGVLPGTDVAVGVRVENSSAERAVENLRVEILDEDDWQVVVTSPAESVLAPGAATTETAVLTVPASQAPGTVAVGARVSFSISGTELVATAHGTVDIVSPVEFTEVTASPTVLLSEQPGTVTATLRNHSDVTVSGHVTVTPPEGWWVAVPSEGLVLAPGESTTFQVQLSPPLTLDERQHSVEVGFARNGHELTARTVTVGTDVARPASDAAIDHIDLGDGASEAAHGLSASSNSGTSTEGGLTRRYAGTVPPGYFAFDMTVPIGEPFLIIATETFDGASLKNYTILVDDVVLREHVYQRTVSGAGASTYQVLVDDPDLFSDDGTVRLTFRHNGVGFDPSLADVWTLEVPADTLPPVVTATVVTDLPGQNGWLRGAATVTLTATDDRPGDVRLEVDRGDGWTDYDAPVVIDAQGTSEVRFRGADVAGNVSEPDVVTVRIDGLAPTVSHGIDDGRRLTLTAADEVSGVALLEYRLGDDGEWVSYSEPVMVPDEVDQVSYRAVDVAGNASEVLVVQVPVVTPSPTPTLTPTLTPTPTATPTPSAGPRPDRDLYETPGFHTSGGRHWMTACEAYSSVVHRCWTYIWGTTIHESDGLFAQVNGWQFNNLTYIGGLRADWASNPLGYTNRWTASDGRLWRTECDTANTGRGGCRSYVVASVIERSGNTFRYVTKEVFNNQVRFR